MINNITKKHNYWVSFLQKKGCSKELSEDLVQNLYLKILEKYKVYESYAIEGEVSEGFFAVCLKNMFLDYKKNLKNKMIVFEPDLTVNKPNLSESDNEIERKRSLEILLSRIEEIISVFEYEYDRELAKEYFYSSKSMRDLSKLTGISLTSIYNSISNYKEFISYKLKEDITDYFNEDYELIK